MFYRFFPVFALFIAGMVQAQQQSDQIAFIADIHLLDIYADYQNFEGLEVPTTSKKAKIRTMAAQLHSTRLFNENYFVLLATLDDIVSRGIKIVALPGDYTDDGQPLNIAGLKNILKHYATTYNITFLITTGNHDPVRPYDSPGRKKDFMGKNGKNQSIFSEYDQNTDLKNKSDIIIEPKLTNSGYDFILNSLADFGFFPNPNYTYWETPFSNYNSKNYRYKKAKRDAHISKRTYPINDTLNVPDASYLVEPVNGLWILAIDGNTYVPQKNGTLSSASIGYNQSIDYKKHLFTWIKDVAKRAKIENKKLVAFSHYPAIDFNEDATPILKEFLGPDKWQLERVPQEHIAETLAKAGVRLHFAGHMHINDTGKRAYTKNDFLINIQTPSLAAYIPAYKILSLSATTAKVKTIPLTDIPRFNELFPLYQLEQGYLRTNHLPVWDQRILESKNYHEFTVNHLENLVKLRFLPNDWDKDFSDYLSNLDGKDLYQLFIENGDLEHHFFNWSGYDMILDFYKIRNADKLAFRDIPAKRLKEYRKIIAAAKANPSKIKNQNAEKLNQFLSIFDHFMNGLPANYFEIDLQSGDIIDLN